MKMRVGILIVTILALLLTGCDTYSALNRYPWYKSAEWYCEEIDMAISFELNEDKKLMKTNPGFLTINGETYEVGVGFQAGAIGFLVKFDGNDYYTRVMDGSWEYRQGNMVISIKEESIWGGKYTELVFVPMQ